MSRVSRFRPAFFLAAISLAAVASSASQKPPKDTKPLPRTVWSLEGGAFFATDGKIPNGPCFRMLGQVSAPGFFEKLKRVDDNEGTRYVRETEAVREFPPRMEVSITIHDFPCSFQLREKGFASWLTKEDVGKLRLRLYWKRGVELRQTTWAQPPRLLVRTLVPNIKPEANDLPERYEWNITFALPCEGVPIEDSLVFVLETPEGSVAARTSARL
jgi:hypothetical protein